jgi:PPOX class probable F420-dependent enzyme
MIDDTVKALATGPNFAALTTMLESGFPQTNIVWVDADDEHVLINTEVGRQKYTNVQRDPRVAVAVIDRDNPYHYVEVRGRVVGETRGKEAREHIDKLSQKYLGHSYENEIKTERVVLKIAPERQRAQ